MKRTITLALFGLICLIAAPSVAQARYSDGMTVYEYVRSAPIVFVDPMGLALIPASLGNAFSLPERPTISHSPAYWSGPYTPAASPSPASAPSPVAASQPAPSAASAPSSAPASRPAAPSSVAVGHFETISHYRFSAALVNSAGARVAALYRDEVNCLGYACRLDRALVNVTDPEKERASLKQVMTAMGYDCAAGISAFDCKEHCNCQDFVMLYIYIMRVPGGDQIRKTYQGKDLYIEPIVYGGSTGIDFHALRGEDEGYTFQGHRAQEDQLNIEAFSPTTDRPDYFGQSQTLGKYCCCRKGNRPRLH